MSNRLAIIGGGPNLAMQTARRFGREGWQICLGARNIERLEAHKAELAQAGIDAVIMPVDATDHGQVHNFIAGIEDRHGPIDVLNYNAAAIRQAKLLEQAPDTIGPDLMTNVGGAMFALQALLPRMRDRKAGTVILSGGGLAINPWPDFVSLSVGKAGLRALAIALGKDADLADIHVVHAVLDAHITHEVAGRIADLYWDLAQEQKGSWQTDVTFSA